MELPSYDVTIIINNFADHPITLFFVYRSTWSWADCSMYKRWTKGNRNRLSIHFLCILDLYSLHDLLLQVNLIYFMYVYLWFNKNNISGCVKNVRLLISLRRLTKFSLASFCLRLDSIHFHLFSFHMIYVLITSDM